MKRKIIIVAMVVFGSLILSLVRASDTRAVTCSGVSKTLITAGGEISSDYNEALKNACNYRENDTSNYYGALWLNTRSTTDSSSDPSNAYALVYVGGEITASSYVNVRVHGAIIADFNYAGDAGTQATHIKFVKTSSRINGTASGYTAYAPLEVPSDFSIDRPLVTTTDTIKSGVSGDIKLRVGSIVNNSSYYDSKTSITSGTYAGYTAYKVNLQAFRCYGDTTPSATNESCYSDPTTIVILAKTSTSATVSGTLSATKVGSTNISDSTYGFNWTSGSSAPMHTKYNIGLNTSSSTVTFRATLSTSDSKSYTTAYQYRFWYSDTNEYTNWSNEATMTVGGYKDIPSKSITVSKGSSQTVCLQFRFYNSVGSDGTYSGSAYLPSNTSTRCVELSRPSDPKYKITVYGIRVNSSGTYLSDLSSGNTSSSEVTSGGKAEVTRKTISGYTFKGWKSKTSKTTYDLGTDIEYNAVLTANKTVFAIYEKKKFTLTAKACDTDGNYLGTNDVIKDVKVEGIEYDNKATVTRGTNSAYTFKGFKVSTSCSAAKNASYVTETSTSEATYISNNGTKYNVKNLTSNAKVYAIYEVKNYKLTVTADAHTTVSVSRSESPYKKAGTGEIANVKNGTTNPSITIYYGDELSVSYSYDGCTGSSPSQEEWVKKTESVTGNTDSVNGDVTVTAEAKNQAKTLTVHYRDFSDSSTAIKDDETVTVCKDKSAAKTRPTITNYNFVGWKQATWSGSADSYCGTSCGSGTSAATLSGSTKTDKTNTSYAYDTYTKTTMSAGAEVWAVYARKYSLSVTADNHSWAKVYRTSSPYAKSSTSTTTALAQSVNTSTAGTAVIYKGDELKFTYGLSDCYKINTHTVDATTRDNNYVWTVDASGSTAVVGSEVIKYRLTTSAADGTSIVVDRKSSPNGGLATGSVSAGNNVLACGDTIVTTYTLNTGYSWGNYEWADNTNEWGWHFKGNNVDVTGPKNSNNTANDPTNHTSPVNYPTSGTHTVRAAVTAETQAVRNEFKGLAKVAEGTSISGKNYQSTGYKNTDTDRSLEVDCANSGCKATFGLYLRTITGTGSTGYRTGVLRNNTNTTSASSFTWVPATTTAMTAITPLTSGSRVSLNTVDLSPGENVCHSLLFKPYGSAGNNDTVRETACVKAKPSYFQGKSTATAGDGATIDGSNMSYTNTTRTNNLEVECASTGCTVTLAHKLKRTEGTGSTTYTIARVTNAGALDGGRAISNATLKNNQTFSSDESTVQTQALKLYPGMMVCETMTFLKSNDVTDKSDKNVSTTICAYATGNAQPDDPNDPTNPSDPEDPDAPDPSDDPNGDDESSAFINMEVKNTRTDSRYNSYRRLVYAAPGDTLDYRSSYTPTLQYAYKLIPSKVKFNKSSAYPASSKNTNRYLGLDTTALKSMFNTYRSQYNSDNNKSLADWNNGYSVQSTNFNDGEHTLDGSQYQRSHTFAKGAMTTAVQYNQHVVSTNEVGTCLKEIAKTNTSITTGGGNNKTTPSQVVFSFSSNMSIADTRTTQKTSAACARVPYNFTTEIDIPKTSEPTPDDENGNPEVPEDNDGKDNKTTDIAYAGETKSISYTITINPRTNAETNKTYATIVRDAKVRVVVYVPGDSTPASTAGGSDSWGNSSSDICSYYRLTRDDANCGYASSLDGQTFNNGSDNLNGDDKPGTASFNVPDLNAGSQICTAVAMYPASSGSDTNLSSDGSGTWRISASRCFTIAKKPSVQIWGNGLYAAGKIDVPMAVKNNLYGYTGNALAEYYRIKTNKDGKTYRFGSWAELDIVANGSVTGLSSGAGLGYSGAGLLATPGGNVSGSGSGNTYSFCNISTISFANETCASGVVGGMGGSGQSTGSTDKSSLIARYINGMTNEDDEEDETEEAEDETADETETKKTVHLITSANDLPSVISKGETWVLDGSSNDSIEISHNIVYEDGYSTLSDVPKLIIYAKNIIISCNVTRIDAVLIADEDVNTCKEGGVNDQIRSQQLKINGSIITNTLTLRRTYGAAKGNNSIVPAEIVNYDSTLYLWGQDNADISASGKMSTTYIHELAPRY